MSKSKKTVPVAQILKRANEILALDNQHVNADFRRGVASLMEHILHQTGNYQGFNYVAWTDEGGCEQWRRDGMPVDNDKYLGDRTRIFFYGDQN